MDKLTREWFGEARQKSFGELATEAKKNPEHYIKIQIDDYCSYVPILYSVVPLGKERAERHGFVYIITDGEFVKIGQTKNIENRLVSIQCGNPREISVLQIIETQDMSAVEQSLHWWYGRYHVRGEWFDLIPVFFNPQNSDVKTSDSFQKKLTRAKEKRALRKVS